MTDWIGKDGKIFSIENNCICPYCHIGVDNKILSVIPAESHNGLYILAQCPLCKGLFFIENYAFDIRERIFKFKSTFPSNAKLDLPKQIIASYPEFAHIYVQSLIAQHNKLDLISGMGLRKALEYLVKPYVKSLHPDVSSEIDQEPLSKTIDRIPYPLITNLAKAAVWLGNDQVHTKQWHINYNFDDINRFILALCRLIEAEQIATNDTPGVLNNPKKQV